MDFQFPWILLLLPVVLVWLVLRYRRQDVPAISFPSTAITEPLRHSWRVRFRWLPFALRLLVISLFLLALAGPRLTEEETSVVGEGIDMVLALDVSGSMAAEDFILDRTRVNRLDIVKKVVAEFVEQREYDRIALVAFAGVAYTVCPLTTDYDWLLSNLERIRLGLIEDGTAIGSAIASSLTRLRNSDAESKVIILLTDGINNAGRVKPLQAAKAAETLGIKIYTIGAGTSGAVPFPATDFYGRKVYRTVRIDIDEQMLTEIAETTGGQYFRATDSSSLRQIYQHIDQLEKSEIEEIGYLEYELLFDRFLLAGFLVLALEWILGQSVFRGLF